MKTSPLPHPVKLNFIIFFHIQVCIFCLRFKPTVKIWKLPPKKLNFIISFHIPVCIFFLRLKSAVKIWKTSPVSILCRFNIHICLFNQSCFNYFLIQPANNFNNKYQTKQLQIVNLIKNDNYLTFTLHTPPPF